MSDLWFPILLVVFWFMAICTVVVIGQIGRHAIKALESWYRNRIRYKLPKRPKTYRLN